MPFTLAHPAIVLPLSKTRYGLSFTGLVLGSMVPDLEFFIHLREVENVGHHWYGIFLFDLPVAILLTFLFHNILRNSFIANLPRIYKKRFIHLLDFDWNRYALKNKGTLLLSALIGVLSHLGWDAFTHHDGMAVEWIPGLANSISLWGHQLPVYMILQILFSIAGMMMVHLQLMQIPAQQTEFQQHTDFRYWLSFTLLFLMIVSFRLIFWPQFNSVGGIAIAVMGSLFYSWIPVSIFFRNKIQIN